MAGTIDGGGVSGTIKKGVNVGAVERGEGRWKEWYRVQFS